MGMSKSFFVGVYVVVKVKPESMVETQGEAFCTVNEEHRVGFHAKFVNRVQARFLERMLRSRYRI